MLRVETVRSAHELDRLKERWRWLETQCEGTLFQSYELNRQAARWFAARETPHLIVAESDSGLAIIPAVRRERELGLIGETLFDYRDVLNAGDPKVLECAWRELAQTGLSLEVTALRGEAARERWQPLRPTPFCNAPTTRLADVTAEEFTAAHHKSAKASRRLAREGLRLVRRQSRQRESGLLNVARWIYRRKAEWRGQSENLFLSRRRQNFMLFLVRSGVLDCTVWSYEDGYGEVAAALLTFRQRRIRHFYTIHHDPRWERFSPGQVMIFDVTRETLREGWDVDFMTGEYPYKNRLATAMVPLYRVMASAEQMACWKAAAPGVTAPAA
jgi:CelD/BcsL family acetyltransferase involved in cellulose biosynthesis